MLTPEQIAEGWIEHDGGEECPSDIPMQIMLVDGSRSGHGISGRSWRWGRSTPIHPYDIIAYRPGPRHD